MVYISDAIFIDMFTPKWARGPHNLARFPSYEQITLLSRGLKLIPSPVTTENNIRRELLNDFDLFTRRMRLQYIYYGKEREPHLFHVKSDWNPLVQPSVSLRADVLWGSSAGRLAFRGFRNLPIRSEIRARRDSVRETKT